LLGYLGLIPRLLLTVLSLPNSRCGELRQALYINRGGKSSLTNPIDGQIVAFDSEDRLSSNLRSRINNLSAPHRFFLVSMTMMWRPDCSGSLSMCSLSCIHLSIASLLKRHFAPYLKCRNFAHGRCANPERLGRFGRCQYLTFFQDASRIPDRAGVPNSVRLSGSAHCIPAFRAIQQINHSR
jgi:hypothetical protein